MSNGNGVDNSECMYISHLWGEHGEVCGPITTFIEVVGVSRDLCKVTGSVVELGIPLSSLQDAVGLCVCTSTRDFVFSGSWKVVRKKRNSWNLAFG